MVHKKQELVPKKQDILSLIHLNESSRKGFHETTGMLVQRVDLPELEKELSDLINPRDYHL